MPQNVFRRKCTRNWDELFVWCEQLKIQKWTDKTKTISCCIIHFVGLVGNTSWLGVSCTCAVKCGKCYHILVYWFKWLLLLLSLMLLLLLLIFNWRPFAGISGIMFINVSTMKTKCRYTPRSNALFGTQADSAYSIHMNHTFIHSEFPMYVDELWMLTLEFLL